MPNVLFERIIAQVPRKFWTHLRERQFAIYKQSVEISFGEFWTRAEALSLMPANRRALWESAQRQAAIASGLKPFDVPHVGDNCSCVTIRTAELVITGHFVDGPRQVPREAESRKQNAALNRYFEYYTDERLLTRPLPKLDRKPVYINVLHGAHFPSLKSENIELDETTCFLRVAVPAQDCRTYLFNWSVDDLLAEYSSRHDIQAQQELEDKAHPKRKVAAPGERTKDKGRQAK